MRPENAVFPPDSLNELYASPSQRQDIVKELWGVVPANLMEALNLAVKVRESYEVATDRIEALKKGMKNQLRDWGILTSHVEENIDKLGNGVAETGQQPMCLGGPSLILNKIACSTRICEINRQNPIIPLFYIADYDGVQNELLNIRVPSQSPRGLPISLPADDGLIGSPIYELEMPSETWLRQTLEKVLNNYKGLLRNVDGRVRDSKLMNLEHALTILKITYYSSENVSEWSTKILGSLINIEADLGVPILAFSTRETRPLFQSGFEILLAEPNRSRFIEVSNKAVEVIEGANYSAQIGAREPDYVPFFLECMNEGCRRKRIELRYRTESGSSTSYVKGKCPSCGDEYEFSFESSHPDLSDMIGWISPRVDSRQIIVDSVLPVLCHVGGPGETGYYAEVIPASKSLKIPFPTFFRYTRTFYNTPWNSKLAENLHSIGYPILTNEELFSAIGRWVEARNHGEAQNLTEAHSAIREIIESTFETLLEKARALEYELEAIRNKLRNTMEKSALINELHERQSLFNAINVYLSSQFGRFSSEKFGQEVNWSWLDLAAVSGICDLMPVFLRQYNEHTPNSSMFFVNL